MKVISKQQISGWNHQQSVARKRETRQIAEEAAPPKPEKTQRNFRVARSKAMSMPRPRTGPPPQELIQLLQARSQQHQPQVSQYTEYKDCLERTLNTLIASGESGRSAETLRDRIAHSRDIKSILKDRIFRHLNLENDLAVLCATVAGHYLENKWGDVRACGDLTPHSPPLDSPPDGGGGGQ